MSDEDVQITSVVDANGQSLPLQGSSLGGAPGTVKQERADDAEIRELAAKMKEQQKHQAAQLASRQAMQQSNGAGSGGGAMQPPITNGNGQTNIMSYLSRHQKLPNGTMQVVPALAPNGQRANGSVLIQNQAVGAGAGGGEGAEKKSSAGGPCDEESIMGRFGWAQFGKVSIPYIYRQTEKYCSVRMIELKLLGKYLNCLHPDIYSSCTCVRSYYITDSEARLFIEVNHKHCDGEFGRDIFTQKDLVVRLGDASKFFQFLDICYRKLVTGSKTPSEKCGFIRINKESVVPYTVRNNQQVVPLFYFEGETENLKTKAELLNGWDLAYLKFCCKVQGIRNELFSSENVAVISLTDIKSYFPNGTEFEDYWPSKVVDSNLLIGNRANVNNSVNWTRQPSAPPPKITTTVSTNPSSNAGTAGSNSTNSGASVGGSGGGGGVGVQKSQQSQQHNTAAAAQHLIKQRAAAAANANGVSNTSGFGASQAAAAAAAAFNTQAVAAAASAAMMQQTAGSNRMLSQATVQALASSGWMSGQSNLQLHAQMMAQQSHAASANRAGSYREHMNNLMMSGSSRQSYSYNNPAISMSSVNSHSASGGGNAPPPLVRSAAGQNANHMSLAASAAYLQQHQQAAVAQQRMAAVAAHHAQQNGRSSSNAGGGGSTGSTGGSSSGSNSSSSGSASANSASLHLQRHAALAHAAAAASADGAQRLCVIPEIPTNNMNLHPYKIQKVCVDKHLVPCINMKAYNDSEQLMTLIEFQKNFFPSVPREHCKRLIEALGVELYKANRRQVQILMEYDRTYTEDMPLVQVRDIIKYMTQLTFMTRQSEQPPAKRTRTS
ncbi:GL13403 [Drosophila persimilis]|uniref:GL13403 n=1 Tax=Drosophila persimilis TaxID=7234 RepID=B4H391_DROPE|nr:GL13403 [Drosophila persimilis]